MTLRSYSKPGLKACKDDLRNIRAGETNRKKFLDFTQKAGDEFKLYAEEYKQG
jgi:hypothetical protein